MASPTITINLRPVTFHQLLPLANTEYEVSPFDVNGNLLQQQIFEVDATNFSGTIVLPLISTLGASNNVLYTVVCKSDNQQVVFVKPSAPDTLGAFGNLIKVGAQFNATLGFKVSTSGVWTIAELGNTI